MGNRLSKIVTRTGDSGTTGLGDGSRVAKDCLRIDALGEIDELNSCLGVLLAENLPAALRSVLMRAQNELFDLGGEVCIPGHVLISAEHILRLESDVTTFNADLAPLKEFILPGGTRAAALTHLTRTVCRRAERSLVRLHHSETRSAPVTEFARQYLNRLSDLLFVAGRWLNHAEGGQDVLWQNKNSRAHT